MLLPPQKGMKLTEFINYFKTLFRWNREMKNKTVKKLVELLYKRKKPYKKSHCKMPINLPCLVDRKLVRHWLFCVHQGSLWLHCGRRAFWDISRLGALPDGVHPPSWKGPTPADGLQAWFLSPSLPNQEVRGLNKCVFFRCWKMFSMSTNRMLFLK